MNFGVPASAVSNTVWNATTRSLTNIGSTALTLSANIHSSLANAATASFLNGSARFSEINLQGEALANVTWQLGQTDGTTNRAGPSFASAAAFMQVGYAHNTFALSLTNTGTVSGNYDATIGNWVQ